MPSHSDYAALVHRLVPSTPPQELPGSAEVATDSADRLIQWLDDLPNPDPNSEPVRATDWWETVPTTTSGADGLVLHGRPDAQRTLAFVGPGATSLLPTHLSAQLADPLDYTHWGWRVVSWSARPTAPLSTLNEVRPDGTAFINFDLVEAVVDRYTHPTASGPDAWLERIVRERIWHLAHATAHATLRPDVRRDVDRERGWLLEKGRQRWGQVWAQIADAPSRAQATSSGQSMTEVIREVVVGAAERRRASWEVQERIDQLVSAIDRQADPAEITQRQRVYNEAALRSKTRH